VARSFQQRVFGVIARTCAALYGRFPVFGALRGSAAVVRHGDRFLVIERSDGQGLAFPGGLAHPWEPDEQALARELREETGMRLLSCSLLIRYTVRTPYPARISVFRAQADGEVRASWEGTPGWATVAELSQRLTRNLRPVLETGILEEKV
jgi:8-oxo-dGTP pyrophosphatase MutT (NUDIX family)